MLFISETVYKDMSMYSIGVGIDVSQPSCTMAGNSITSLLTIAAVVSIVIIIAIVIWFIFLRDSGT